MINPNQKHSKQKQQAILIKQIEPSLNDSTTMASSVYGQSSGAQSNNLAKPLQQKFLPKKQKTSKKGSSKQRNNKLVRQKSEHEKKNLKSKNDEEISNSMPFNMGPVGHQHPQNMMLFHFDMCPHPLDQNMPFIGPPQAQIMPFMPMHPQQLPPPMMHPPPPVFDPQIMRASSATFKFKKKNISSDNDIQQKKKTEKKEDPRQQVIHQIKQQVPVVIGPNCPFPFQQQNFPQDPEQRFELNNYQPLRQSVCQKKFQQLQFQEGQKQHLHSNQKTPIQKEQMKYVQKSQNPKKQSVAPPSIKNEIIEVSLPRQYKVKSVNKQKKKHLFLSSEQQPSQKLKLNLIDSCEQKQNQIIQGQSQQNQQYNALRSNRSKSPGVYQQNSKQNLNKQNTNQFVIANQITNHAQSNQIQKMLSLPSQQNSKPLRLINRQSENIFDYRFDRCYEDQTNAENMLFNDDNLNIHSPLQSHNSCKSEQDYKLRIKKEEVKTLSQGKNFNNVLQFDSMNQAQPLSPFIPFKKNQPHFQANSKWQNDKNSQIINGSIDQNQSVSFLNKSQSLSQSLNHPLSANCLRKCTQWQLTLCDQIKNPAVNKLRIKPLVVSQNSAVALRQMNYHYEEGLSKDELNAKKQRIQIPSGPSSFEYDIIDQMMLNEDQHIFDPFNQEFHAKHCPLSDFNKKKNVKINERDGPPEVPDQHCANNLAQKQNCCQPQLKQFNFYNQRSYINQPIKLPFDMNQINSALSQKSGGAYSQLTDENFDLMSQISSQLSEQSKNGSQFSQNNGGPSAKSSDTAGLANSNTMKIQQNANTMQHFNQLHIREQMLQILNVQQAENMMCLEFDLQDYPIVLPEHEKDNPEMIEQVQSNQRFRVINQSMIESMIHLRLKAACHGNTLFSPSEMTLNFNIQGKKLIKSIQDRILRLKEKLAFSVQQMHAQELGLNNKTYQQKYFLNMVEKNNRHNKGPWISQTKQSLVVKLLNFNGRSIAFQIAVPDLYNLPNLMTNFNQLVLREFVIEKIFVCFDLPLSKINSIQAQQIDVENYLTAKKISSPYQNLNSGFVQPNQWVINSPTTIFVNGMSNQNSGSQNAQEQQMASSSQGTPIMNLLNVYQEMKADNDGVEGQLQGSNLESLSSFQREGNSLSSNLHHPIQSQINSIEPLKSCADIQQNANKQVEQRQDLLKPQDHLAHPAIIFQDKKATQQLKQNLVQFPLAQSTLNSTNSNTKGEDTFRSQQSLPYRANLNNQVPTSQPQFGMTQVFYPMQNNTGQTFMHQMNRQNQSDFQTLNQGKNQTLNGGYESQTSQNEHSGQQILTIAPQLTINNYFSIQPCHQQMQPHNYQNWYQHQQQMQFNQYPIGNFVNKNESDIMFGGQQVFNQGLMSQPNMVGQGPYFQMQQNNKNVPQAVQQEVQPGSYSFNQFLKDDRSQMCNFDRFIIGTMPQNLNCRKHTVSDLIEAYHKVSLQGVQIQLFDDRSEKQSFMFTFSPTLSSLYLLTLAKSNKNDSQTDRNSEQRPQKVIEFHESQPHYKRKLLSHAILEHTKDLAVRLNKKDLTSIDVSSSCSSYGSSALQSLDSQENHRQTKPREIIQETIKESSISESVSTEFSWFSILWTCQKQQPISSQQLNQQQKNSQPVFDGQNLQFLVIYKFSEKYSLEVVGMLSSKLDREEFWLTPSQLCENEIEGEIFDEIYDSNIIRLQDMQEKCIKFMKEQGNLESSFDLIHILKGQQIESQSRDRVNERLRRDLETSDINLQQMIQKMSLNLDAQPLYNQNGHPNQNSSYPNYIFSENQLMQNIQQFL